MKPIAVEDLAATPEAARTHTIDVTLDDATLALLELEAARRSVSIDDFLRWAVLTAAESENLGGSGKPGSS